MTHVELTHAVLHKSRLAATYRCVRVHFLETDQHFWIAKMQTEKGVSVANWLPTDEEIADIIDARLKAPNPEDCLIELSKKLREKGYFIKMIGG